MKNVDELTLPGMDRPVRRPSPDFPPNQKVVAEMSDMSIHYGDDCSEIAEHLLESSGGKGSIIEVKPNNRGDLNVFENGQNVGDQYYHQVYTDGKYVYDPRLSSKPIPRGDWEQHIRATNPNGISISSNPKGL